MSAEKNEKTCTSPWYAEAVAALGGEDQVVASWGEDDYSGPAYILAAGARTLFWRYGTCETCDSFIEMTEGERIEALRREIDQHPDEAAARRAYDDAVSKGW